MVKKEFSFPFLSIKTEAGLSLIERLSKTSIAKRSGWVFILLLPVLAAITIYFVLSSIVNILTNPNVSVMIRELGPAINLPWPGVNPYLPVVYGWVALLLGMAVHEFAHGVQARASGVPVRSVGLMFVLIFPIAAFAEIDDKELEKTSLKKISSTLAGGAGMNFFTAIAALLILLLIVSSLVPITDGILIKRMDQEGPAYKVGIKPGDIIVGVNGLKVNSLQDFINIVEPVYKPGINMTFDLVRDGEKYVYEFTLVKNPDNSSRGYMGIQEYIPLGDVAENYASALWRFPSREALIYIVLPTLPGATTSAPFSDLLHSYYVSDSFLGNNFYEVSNLLYWIWLINFNLAIFNAIPLYPLDGGYVFKFTCRRLLGKKAGETGIKLLVYSVSLLLVALIVFMIAAPYLM
ncbi:MAG: site-2 protease family protein [Nitrososphaeria archaeon]